MCVFLLLVLFLTLPLTRFTLSSNVLSHISSPHTLSAFLLVFVYSCHVLPSSLVVVVPSLHLFLFTSLFSYAYCPFVCRLLLSVCFHFFFYSFVRSSVRPACLRVSPDRSQFFRYDSISLSCEHQLNSTGWKVKRKTTVGGVRSCSSGWGSASSRPTCIIGNTYPSDSGVYWCESEDGERSNSVNITITGTAHSTENKW